ncbi:hypothetical protein KM043_018806 [Ampulex compressa]|nr:hypothetical protein KM043_018806 [Ampulex compressa]
MYNMECESGDSWKPAKLKKKKRVNIPSEPDAISESDCSNTSLRKKLKKAKKTNTPLEKRRNDSSDENEFAEPSVSTEPGCNIKLLLQEIINTCKENGEGISPKGAAHILQNALTLQNTLANLAKENTSLRLKLSDRSTVEGKLNVLDTTLNSAVEKLTELKQQLQRPEKSYAQIVGVKSRLAPPTAVKPPKNLVVIYPNEKQKNGDSESTKKLLMATIAPVTEKLKIRNLRKINNGGLLLETQTKEDMEAVLENTSIRDVGLVTSVPSKRKPLMIVHGIPKDMSEQDIISAIKNQNFEHIPVDDAAKEFCLRFKTGDRLKDTVSWVAEVSPRVREEIRKADVLSANHSDTSPNIARQNPRPVGTAGVTGTHSSLALATLASQSALTSTSFPKSIMAVKPNSFPNSSKVTVGQLNARGSITAMGEIRQIIYECGIDIMLIQEPYCSGNLVQGLGIHARIVTSGEQFSNIHVPGRPKAAIVVFNPDTRVISIDHLCNTHFACAEISSSSDSFVIVSGYLQFSDQIDPYLHHLDKIMNALKGHSVILCLDANAKSPLWHCSAWDPRGEALEDFISQHQLFILNSPSDAHTFDNLRGKTNIDVTLTNNRVFRRTSKWEIRPHATISDHNLITFEVGIGPQRVDGKTTRRFNTARADWQEFAIQLRKLLAENWAALLKDSETDVHLHAEQIETLITAAADTSIPRKTRFNKSAPWWNQELAVLRKEVQTSKRRSQRTEDLTARKRLLGVYRRNRNNYISAIRSAKKRSWEQFVTKEGNKSPWSIVYKLQMNKLAADTVFASLRVKGTQTSSWEETMSVLLNELVPDDTTESDTLWHMAARVFTKIPSLSDNSPPFTADEIFAAIKKLRNGKAPGRDLIVAEIIKNAWGVLHAELTALYNCCLSEAVFPRAWKQAHVITLLKGDDKVKSCPKSYRPISLLPILGKILEKLIESRIKDLIYLHPDSSPRQFGFRKGKSTEDAIVELRRIVVAYADDLLVVVTGSSRQSLEERANLVTGTLERWCRRQKLQVSTTKSEMILLKGSLDTRRPPTVKVGAVSLKLNTTVRYLGIHFGTRLNISPHVTQICNKARRLVNRLSIVAKTHWGLNCRTMRSLYKGLFVPIVTYAAAGWADSLNVHHKRRLDGTQRYALLRVTKGYRTISNDALPVIAAEIPIVLMLEERRALFYLKRNLEFKTGNFHYIPSETPLDIGQLSDHKKIIRNEILDMWQKAWETSTKGRLTYAYISKVRDRLEAGWIELDHYLVQLLSGHGNINDKLYNLGLKESGECTCGEPDTVPHIIYDCEALESLRIALIEQVVYAGKRWPCSLSEFLEKSIYAHFKSFAKAALRYREQQS